MKRDITREIPVETKRQLDLLAKSLGTNAFFIQDTETTGVDAIDQIHDFAGLYYNRGKVYQIQYYVVQPNDRDENGVYHIRFDELREEKKGTDAEAAFETLMGVKKDSNKVYIAMREALDKKTWDENDPMITRENLARLLRTKYSKVPNFTYNAVFDIKMEKKLEGAIKGNIKFNEVYDVLTMAADLLPGFLSEDMGKELGRGKLSKVYNWLNEHYKTKFAPFKTSALTGKQTHTAWDDVFAYTVPVLNFLIAELKERGYKIQSYKNIQHYWNTERLKNIQDITDAGLTVGLNLKDYYIKHGSNYKWVEGTIGKQHLLALREMDIYSQLVKKTVQAIDTAIESQKIAVDLEKDLTSDELAEEKKLLRQAQAQKRAIMKEMPSDPRQRKMAQSNRLEIEHHQKRIRQLEKKKAKYMLSQKRMRENQTQLMLLERVDTEETKRLRLDLEAAKGDHKKIDKKIKSYVDRVMKKYNGTRIGVSGVVWDHQTGMMRFPVNGKMQELPYPKWWAGAWAQKVKLSKEIEELDNMITMSMANPKQAQIDQIKRRIAKYDKRIEEYNKRIIGQTKAMSSKKLTEEALLAARIKDVTKKRDHYLHAYKNGKDLPPAYYSTLNELEKLKKKMGVFEEYDKKQSELADVNRQINLFKDNVKEIRKNPEITKTILYKDKPVQIGLINQGKSAYFLTKTGKLGQKVPDSVWDSKKGIIKGSVQLPDYNPSKEHFIPITSRTMKNHPELLQDMTITPIKMGLYTGVTKAGKGYLIRAHESRVLDPEQALRIGKSKIYSVSEISNTVSAYFGREGGENWKTDFGTTHHRIVEAIRNGELTLRKDGSLNPIKLKRFVINMWQNGTAEDRADMRSLFTNESNSKLIDANLSLLNKTVSEYLKYAKKLGLPTGVNVEKTLGMQLNVGGKVITISGTIDQFWVMGQKVMLGDLKTSKEISASYVVQLSLYRALLRLYESQVMKGKGLSVSSKMKIFLTPADKEKIGDVVNIQSMSDKELASFAYEAVTALEEKSPIKQTTLIKKLQEKWVPKLESHIGMQMVTVEVETPNGPQERHFINGESLGEIGAKLNKMCPMSEDERIHHQNYIDGKKHGHYKNMTYIDFLKKQGPKALKAHYDSIKKRAKVVDAFFNRLKDPNDKRFVKNLLFLRGEIDEFLYDNPIYNDYREYKNPEMFSMVLIDRKGKVTANEEWVKKAKTEGFYKTSGRSVSLGGLTAKEWIRLFRAVDLDFSYNGLTTGSNKSIFAKTNITKNKQALIKKARKMGNAYVDAVEELTQYILTSPDHFFQGAASASKGEEYFIIKSFVNKLETEAGKAIELPPNFLKDVTAKYNSFLASHPDFKNYSLTQFIHERTDKATRDTYNKMLDAQAANRLLEIPGLNALVSRSKEFGQEMDEEMSRSIDLYKEKTGAFDDEQILSKTEAELKLDEEMEDMFNANDSSYTVYYEKYDPAKKDRIMSQLAHRVARMLTRKELGDKVYKKIYNKYFKKDFTYEEFLKTRPKEQYYEYLSSGVLAAEFERARKSNKLGTFLLDIANKTNIGADEESKNLLSLIRSIKEQEPSILTDPNILATLADQVNGAKMARYGKFDSQLIAELGLPLTMVGKELKLSKKGRNPYKTYVKNSQEFLKLLESGQYDTLRGSINKILKDKGTLDEDSIDDIWSSIDPLLRKLKEYMPYVGNISQALEDFNYWSNNITSKRRELVEIQKGYNYYGKAEDIQDLKREIRADINLKKEAISSIGKYFKLIDYLKANVLKLNDPKVINRINKQIYEVDKDYYESNAATTKAIHEAILKEEAGDMAQNGKVEVLLTQILQALQGTGPRTPVSPYAVTGSGEEPIPQAEDVAPREKKTAEEMAKGELAIEKEILGIEKQIANLRAKEKPTNALEGTLSYLKEKYAQEKAHNTDAAKKDGMAQALKLARQDVRKDLDYDVFAKQAYTDMFSKYVDSELNAKQAIDKITADMKKEQDAGHLQTVAYLTKSLTDAQTKYDDSVRQTQTFLDQHDFTDNDIIGFNKIRQARYDEAKEAKLIADTKTEETDRLAREKEYVELLNTEAAAKEKLNNLNIQLAKTEEGSAAAKRLATEKRQAKAEVKAAEKASRQAYGAYLDQYGYEEVVDEKTGEVRKVGHKLSGEVLQTPGEALKDKTRLQRAKLTEAKRNKAIDDYNKLADEQESLAAEEKRLRIQAKRLGRKGDHDSEKIAKDQAEAIKKRLLTEDQWKEKEEAVRQTFGKKNGKLPSNFTPYSSRVASLDEKYKLQLSEEEYNDFKSAKGSYATLKRQEADIMNQMYRNDLKYRTTFNKKERGALDVQQQLYGMDLRNVQQELERFSNDYKDVKGFAEAKGALDKQFSDIQAKNIANANVAFKGETSLFGKLATSFKGMMYQFTQFGAAYKILGAIKQGINNIITSAKNLDKAMTDLRIVTGQSGDEAHNTMTKFSKLAGELGATTTEVAAAGTAWLRQGYDMAQVTDLITSSLYLSRLGMISVDEATKDLTSSLKGFKLEATDAMDVVDKLTALDVKAATTAGEIATGLAQFANIANLNGVSIDQASAMVATIADVSQVSGAQAGNSLKMMLSRYGTVKSGKFDSMMESGEGGEALNDVEKVLNRIGVSVKDSNAEFREFDDVLADIADKWDTLDNVTQNAIATAMAGTRQREAFLVLMSNMDKYKEFTKISENSKGTAETKYQSYQEQLEASQKRLSAAWEEFAHSAEISKLLKIMTDLMTKLVKHLPTIIKYLSRWITMSQGYKLPGLLQQFGFGNGLDNVIGWGKQAAGNIRGLKDVKGFKARIRKLSGIDDRNQKVDEYYNGEHGIFSPLTKPINDLTTALNKNTEALTGETQAENQSTQAENQNTQAQNQNTQADNQQTVTTQQNTAVEQQSSAATSANTAAVTNNTAAQKTGGGSNPAAKGNRMANFGKAAGSIFGGITTALTSDSTQKDIYGTDDTETKSGGLRMGSKITTGAITGVATYFGGPIGGMIASALMDEVINPYLLPVFEKWLDNDSYQLKVATKAARNAEKNLEILSELKDSTNNLVSLNKEDILIGESYSEAEKAIQGIMDTVFATKESRNLWKELVKNTGLAWTSTVDLKKAYLSGSKKDREAITAALQAAIAWQEAREFAATKIDDLFKNSKDLQAQKQISTGWNLFTPTLGGLFSATTYGGVTGNEWTEASSAMSANVLGKIGIFSPDLISNLVVALIQGIQGNVNRNNRTNNDFYQWLTSKDNAKLFNASIYTEDTTFSSDKSVGENILTFLPLAFGIPALKTTSRTVLDITDHDLARAMEAYVDHLQEEVNKLEEKEKTEGELDLVEQAKRDSLYEDINEYEDKLEKINAALERQRQIYEEINSKYAQAAVASAKTSDDVLLSLLGNRRLKHMGKDEIIKLVADELEKQGGLMAYDRYDSSGELSSEWLDAIMGALRGDSKLWGIISGNSYTLSELLSTTGDASKDAEMQASALRQFAAALGVSVEELKELEATFGNLTLAQVIASPETTRNSIGELTSLFTSMASSTGLTAENLEKIINHFPELVQYLGNTEKMANAMSGEIETLVKLYGYNVSRDLLESDKYFDQWTRQLQMNDEEFYNVLSKNSLFANAGSFDEILEMIYGDPEAYGLTKEQQEHLAELVTEAFDIEIENTVEKERVTTAMSYLSKMYERQIQNLEEQKQALQDINKQREYENKLIEAKLKLEDAQKEKKRVWREGVGWVYEADQTAVAEAQKNLDEVKNEKKISELDAQIQQLQSEKDYLDNMPNEEELKNMKDVYDGWAKQVGLYNESQASLLEKIGQIYAGIEKISMGEYLDNAIEDRASKREEMEGKASDLLKAFLDADEYYQKLLQDPNTDRTSEDFKKAEKARNDAMNAYQNFINSSDSKYITSGWYESHSEAQAAKDAQEEHESRDVIEGYGRRFSIDGTPMSDSENTVTAIQKEATAKNSGATYWRTNSDHTRIDGEGKNLKKDANFEKDYDNSLTKWAEDPGNQHTVVANSSNPQWASQIAYVKNKRLYKMRALKHGTLGVSGEPTLINEEGVEAIITPSGTVTALPASSGVVPADITRNLWQLGGIAPAILRSLGEFGMRNNNYTTHVGGSDDSVNIGSISMVVNADSSWDPVKFVEQLRQQASLTKNNKR